MTPSRRGHRDLATTAAALVALAPGFALPFVMSLVLGSQRSDLLLLSTSVALTLINVVGNAIEANTVSEVGRCLGGGLTPDASSLRSYRRRVLRFVALVTFGLGPILIAIYALHSSDLRQFVTLATVMLLVPVLGGMASIRSGVSIARGQVAVPICLQATRSLLPLVLVLAWPSVPLELVALGFGLGELTRLACLTALARRATSITEPTAVPLPTNGMLWQSASVLTAQAGPVTDRVFLNSGPAGSISAYEMADKLFFAAVQLMNLGLLVRRLSGWARLSHVSPDAGVRQIRRDVTMLICVATAMGLAGAGTALLLRQAALPADWRQGLLWSAILLAGLPLSMGVMAGGRLLIIARRQDLLLRLALVFAVSNAILDAIFFVLLGPLGIPVATVATRLVQVVLYGRVVRGQLHRVVGSAYERESPVSASVT